MSFQVELPGGGVRGVEPQQVWVNSSPDDYTGEVRCEVTSVSLGASEQSNRVEMVDVETGYLWTFSGKAFRQKVQNGSMKPLEIANDIK